MPTINIEGIEITKAGPGHVRLTVPKFKGNESLAKEFQVHVAGIRGITAVMVDPVLGEVQMFYNKEQVTSLSSLWAIKDAVGIFFPEICPMRLVSYYFGKGF
jgi:hypothetical protein